MVVWGYAAAFLAFLIFGSSFSMAKLGTERGLTKSDITALRFGVAGLVLLPVLWRQGLGGPGWWRSLSLVSLFGAPYFLITMFGMRFAPALHVVILNPGATSVGATGFAALLLGERLGRQGWPR